MPKPRTNPARPSSPVMKPRMMMERKSRYLNEPDTIMPLGWGGSEPVLVLDMSPAGQEWLSKADLNLEDPKELWGHALKYGDGNWRKVAHFMKGAYTSAHYVSQPSQFLARLQRLAKGGKGR